MSELTVTLLPRCLSVYPSLPLPLSLSLSLPSLSLSLPSPPETDLDDRLGVFCCCCILSIRPRRREQSLIPLPSLPLLIKLHPIKLPPQHNTTFTTDKQATATMSHDRRMDKDICVLCVCVCVFVCACVMCTCAFECMMHESACLLQGLCAFRFLCSNTRLYD